VLAAERRRQQVGRKDEDRRVVAAQHRMAEAIVLSALQDEHRVRVDRRHGAPTLDQEDAASRQDDLDVVRRPAGAELGPLGGTAHVEDLNEPTAEEA
jgi:hypothetical protein